MKPVHQTLFGGPDGPLDEIGNCFPACLASLLEVDLAQVPHVYQLHADNNDAHVATCRFLSSHGFAFFCFDWGPWVHVAIPPGALVMISGKSPRGDFQHVVLGELTGDDWRLVHDPHPSGDGIVGGPAFIEMLVPILRAPANDNDSPTAPGGPAP